MQHNRPTVVDDTSVFVQVVHLCNIMPFQRLCVTSCNIAVSNLKKIHPRRGTCNYAPFLLLRHCATRCYVLGTQRRD